MSHVIVQFNISRQEYLKVYAGAAKTVTTKSLEGVKVQFPADILRAYVDHQGVHGRFKISFDDKNKFVGIVRV
ncbi:MAG: hypothetical protein COW84_07710 [Gammaproteobacteria bacterium CG22_combo_CG10-13_8_21_14_all_40_8]|nr:MAG: hypothetical protein COW84_07710 [Gammaproteobacteria bacterium CG22_combo_CG10-13_8_21_14_all_40_8]